MLIFADLPNNVFPDVVGLPAKHQAVVNSANTVFAFKHLIGRQFSNNEVTNDQKHWYVTHFNATTKNATASQAIPDYQEVGWMASD